MLSMVDFDDEVVHRSIRGPGASPVATSCRVQSKSLGDSSPWLSQSNEIYSSLGEGSNDLYPTFAEKSYPRFGVGAPDDDFTHGSTSEEWTNNTVGLTLGLTDGDHEAREDSLISRNLPRGWSEIRARLQHVQPEHVFCGYYEKATSFLSKVPVYLLFETLSQCLMEIGCEIRMNFEELCLEGQQTENVALIPFRVNVYLASEHDIGQSSYSNNRTSHGHAPVAYSDDSQGTVHLVEFQRRSGDSFEFTRFFHSVLTTVRSVDIADFIAGFPRGVAPPFVDETSTIPSMAVPPVLALPLPPPGPYDAYAYTAAPRKGLPTPGQYDAYSYTSTPRSHLLPPALTSSSASASRFVTDKPVFRSLGPDFFHSDSTVSTLRDCDPVAAPSRDVHESRHEAQQDDEDVVLPPPGSIDCQAVMMCASLLEMIFVGCASQFICSQLESARLLARLSKTPENQSTMGSHGQSLPVLTRLLGSKHEGVARCGLVALHEYLSLDSNLSALVETTSPRIVTGSDSKSQSSQKLCLNSGLRASASDPGLTRAVSAAEIAPTAEQSAGSGGRDERLLKVLVSVVSDHLGGDVSESMQMLAAQILNSIASVAPRAVFTPSHMRWLRGNCSKRPHFLPVVRSTLRKLDRIR